MNRTDLPRTYVERLAELVRLHRLAVVEARHADQTLIWDIPGIKAAIDKTQDSGAQALDIACVALSAADDLAIKTPALMAGSGKHWTHAQTGRPEKRRCPHGHLADTVTPIPGEQPRASGCDHCYPPQGPVTVDWRGLAHQAREQARTERTTP